jgi:hypothetical protein
MRKHHQIILTMFAFNTQQKLQKAAGGRWRTLADF